MQQIQTLVDEIALGYKPEKIYLFGSYANGNPTEDSDIDLLIVKDTLTRKIERQTEVRLGIKNYISAMDIIVYTPNELNEAMNYMVNIGKIAVDTGKIMYERI